MKRLTLAIAISILLEISIFAQAAAPFLTVAPLIPPAVGQPGVTLAQDATNKFVVVTFQAFNAAGVLSTLTTFSYNPRLLEGVSGGAMTFSLGGVTLMLTHNLAADPLVYQLGNSVKVLASCSTVSPVPTGQTACPALTF